MKQKMIILLFLGMLTNHLLAQDEFIISEDTRTQQKSITGLCRTPDLCTIVFTSDIKGILFKIQNDPSLLKSITINNTKNMQYILCLQPLPEGRKYQISITHSDFKGDIHFTPAIRASEIKCYTIDSKNKQYIEELDSKKKDKEKLESTLNEQRSIHETVKKNYNNLSLNFGHGISYGEIGASLGWRSKMAFGLQGGIGFWEYMKDGESATHTHYSFGAKYYPFQNIKQRGTFSFQDLFVMLGYSSFGIKENELISGSVLSIGGDWMIPLLSNPDGGLIINLGVGTAFDNMPFIWEFGIGIYVNL